MLQIIYTKPSLFKIPDSSIKQTGLNIKEKCSFVNI